MTLLRAAAEFSGHGGSHDVRSSLLYFVLSSGLTSGTRIEVLRTLLSPSMNRRDGSLYAHVRAGVLLVFHEAKAHSSDALFPT